MAIVFGVGALARRWGGAVAVCCGLIALLFILPTGLVASAWVGAVGLAVRAVAVAAGSRGAVEPRRAQRLSLCCGVLAGFALLFRLDVVLALGLSILVLGWGADRVLRRRFGIGLAAGLSPYLIHLATAGPGTVWKGMVTDPLFKLRGGRRLPLPPPWGHFNSAIQVVVDLVKLRWPIPTIPGPAQISLWFFLLVASVAALVAAGVWAGRRDRTSVRPRVSLAVAGFSLGLAPPALQRPDPTP